MTATAPKQTESEGELRAAARAADLSELLGHVLASGDDDRRQIARKLHDSLGSSMTALTMHLALLTQQIPADQALQHRTAQMKTLLMNIISANRDMQAAIWNDKLEFLGVKAALAELVTEFGAERHIAARISLPDEEGGYGREQGVALLRAVEEGLRNVAAHAQATEVDVILDENDEQIMLTVRDNGVGPAGFDPAARNRHGLRLLRERARCLGGTLSLAPAPGGGSALTIVLPRAPAAASAA